MLLAKDRKIEVKGGGKRMKMEGEREGGKIIIKRKFFSGPEGK